MKQHNNTSFKMFYTNTMQIYSFLLTAKGNKAKTD